MAKRLLRDWTDSEPMDSLSFEAEVFFTRLIMKADDYGSFHANPKLLKAALFPLKDTVTFRMIGKWVFECVEARLIFPYEVNGKEYIRIIQFGQRLQNMRNAHPHPTETTSPEVTVNHGESPLEVEVEVEENKKKEGEPADATGSEKVARETIPFTPDSPVRDAWNEWEKYRKEKKQTLTPSTIKKQIQFLGGRGDPEIIAIINQSITNGWTGLFEIKNNYKNGRATTKRSSDAVIEGGRPFGTFD